jgi:hypothetical protein
MGMTIRWNPRQLEANIAQIGDRAMKGMTARARVMMFKMRDLARENAPRKTGDLESAIDVMVNRSGMGGRASFVLFIDIDKIRSHADGALGEYAWLMEEQLKPYGRGRFNLGPGSISKAATGKKVGGRFLARAVRDAADIHAELVDEVRKVTGGVRTVPMSFQRPGDDE